MSAAAKPEWISPEQYLLEENDNPEDIRHEYVNGHVYAMAGASRGHNRVTMNFTGLLYNHVKGSPCEVFKSDMKLGIQRQDDVRYYYPGIQISCEQENESYYNTSPCLIIEVLSESTARKDRTEKLLAYQTIPSLQEYILCSQDSPNVEVYRRTSHWQREHYSQDDNFSLESVDITLQVNDLYDFLLDD